MAHKGFTRQSPGVQATHPLDESKPLKSYFGVNGCETRTKGSIYTRRSLKSIYFPGLAAKHGQELSAGHKGTKQKNAAYTPKVHPH